MILTKQTVTSPLIKKDQLIPKSIFKKIKEVGFLTASFWFKIKESLGLYENTAFIFFNFNFRNLLVKSQLKMDFSITEVFKNRYINFFTSFLIFTFTFLFLAVNTAQADPDRIRDCPSATPGGLDYNFKDGGKDFSYQPFNEVCIEQVLSLYAITKGAMCAMNKSCGLKSKCRAFPSPVLDAKDIVIAGTKPLSNLACTAAKGTVGVAVGIFFADVRLAYDRAKTNYDNMYLCGNGGDEEWMKWYEISRLKNLNDGKKSELEKWIDCDERCDNPATDLSSCKSDCKAEISEGPIHKQYREWYFGGVEKEDNLNTVCPDVTMTHDDYKDSDEYNKSIEKGEATRNYTTYNGIQYPVQRYYMRGTQQGNYACEQYNFKLANKHRSTDDEEADEKKTYDYAYNCCVKKSQETICIVRDGQHKFCKGGDLCKVEAGDLEFVGSDFGVVLDIKYRGDNGNMICASTYDLCPYNFNIGGGTTVCDYFKDGANGVDTTPEQIDAGNCPTDESSVRNSDCTIDETRAGRCKNYCQYLNHCVIVGESGINVNSSISSPYFSSACIDFTGDSTNSYKYNTGIFSGNEKHFSAPIAQCIRETLENVFYNQAGHSKCNIIGEYPNKSGICSSGSYEYQKGEPVEDNQSAFSYIQENLKGAIKLVLTLSVTLLGFKVLLGGQAPKGPDLIFWIVKFGLVLYFATGSAWQTYFFDGVYNASSSLSNVVTNIKVHVDDEKKDGCQFGTINLPDGSPEIVSTYPKGKSYLAVWDTMDCKIARYLGFGPTASVANIAKLILASIFTTAGGMLGVYFAVFTMIFGFYMIIITLRALHIFLASGFVIILLVYISPITIVFSLFKKTEDIFKKWLLQLIGYSLQPIFLFAYIGFFVTIFDSVVIGSATFTGEPPQKTISCTKTCTNATTGLIATYDNDSEVEAGDNGFESGGRCDEVKGNIIIDPNTDSVACILNFDNFGSISFLESFGISIPILTEFFTNDGRAKVLTIVKASLIIFVLAGFMGEIPGIASAMLGTGSIQDGVPSMKGMAMGAVGKLGSIAKRGGRAGRKAASKGADGAKDLARSRSGESDSGDSEDGNKEGEQSHVDNQ